MSPYLCDKPMQENTPSPFGRVIAFDYDDGPRMGIVECNACSLAYRFDRLETDVDGIYDLNSWERGQELQVFSLMPMPEDAFAKIVAKLLMVESPRWPVWAPGMPTRSMTFEQLVEREIDPLLNQAGPPVLIVAAPGLLRPIVALREFDHVQERPSDAWLSWLGLTPNAQAAFSPSTSV